MSRVDPPAGGAWSWRTWAVSTTLFALLLGAWVLVTPLHRTPDEPAHHLRAASFVRGQVLGAVDAKDPTGATLVRVPYALRRLDAQPICWGLPEPKPSLCTPSRSPGGTVLRKTQAGRYPPAYYAVTGLPTLAWPTPAGLYGARAVSALLCAALLGTAVTAAAAAGRRSLVVALGVAVTPMVAFLGAALNPNSAEVAAAIAVWGTGAALATTRGPVRPALVTAAGASACVLALMRPISPFWLALAGTALLLLAGRRRLGELVRLTRVRVWAGLVVLACAAQAAWVLFAGALDLSGEGVDLPLGERVDGSWELLGRRTEELVGRFGWLDVPVSDAVLWLYGTGAAVFLIAALRRPRPGRVVGLVVLVLLVVALPIALEVPAVPDVGFWWQGRYTLPLAAGVPVLAAVASRTVDDTRVQVVAWVLVAVLLAGAHVLAFVDGLAHYVAPEEAAGLVGYASWSPPVPASVLLVGHALTAVLLWFWLLRLPLGAAAGSGTLPACAASPVTSPRDVDPASDP